MKQEFTSTDDAEVFLKELSTQGLYIINISEKENKYTVEWQEHKMYTAQDGKSYHDEVWFAEDGRMLQVQDIDADHCRNIIRMILRQDRETKEYFQKLKSILIDTESDENNDLNSVEGKPVLH